MARRDLDAARQLLENALLHRAGDHIQALVIQLSDGPLALVPGPALFNIYLPLSQLASRPVQTDSWSYVGTRQNGRAYHLLRHSLPIIGEPYGAVQGYLHAFVLLNDNFPLLSQIQILSGADTVGLYAGHAPIGLLGAASDRQQALDTINPASPISVTANGTVQQYPWPWIPPAASVSAC
ncbi:LuxQ periplasmic sensor domain-containing protein [Marinobacterium aestuariivivens]|uniref:LuxQ periplasmic sensor domain-containing protein n=1 Tax=Marinobacterium aestuariivivens TaxID=1698799 RepID=A0ABW2A4B9_9GAMM